MHTIDDAHCPGIESLSWNYVTYFPTLALLTTGVFMTHKNKNIGRANGVDCGTIIAGRISEGELKRHENNRKSC